jgi:hypothetical protein
MARQPVRIAASGGQALNVVHILDGEGQSGEGAVLAGFVVNVNAQTKCAEVVIHEELPTEVLYQRAIIMTHLKGLCH